MDKPNTYPDFQAAAPLPCPPPPPDLFSSNWTLGRLLKWTSQFLARKGLEFPRLDSEVLLAHSLQCRRIDLYTRFEENASDDARARFRDLVRRRLEGCPVAYLVGNKEFFSLNFAVSPAVLIPRPETEFVVMECVRLAKTQDQPRIVDIGTGSGNIAIAVARHLPHCQVLAVDVSPEALAVAAANAQRWEVTNRIQFLLGDLFQPIPAGEPFDFVLSNPPYIAQDDLAKLPPGVRDFEPRLALDGGPGGFAVFDRLIREARAFLCPGGHLIVELGAPQEQHARHLVQSLSGYELADTILDYAGHPRVLRARWMP